MVSSHHSDLAQCRGRVYEISKLGGSLPNFQLRASSLPISKIRRPDPGPFAATRTCPSSSCAVALLWRYVVQKRWNHPGKRGGVGANIRSLVWLVVLIALGLVEWGTSSQALAAKFNRKVDIAQAAPDWKPLPATDERQYQLSSFKEAKFLILVFMCNHCPVAKSYEARILELNQKYQSAGGRVVAINVSNYEADKLPEMKKRAQEKKYTFPYLYDGSQQLGRAYGVTNTPQVFLLDQQRRIAYMGRIDDSTVPEKVRERFLEAAIEAVLKGQEPDVTETKPVGCEIQYDE